MPYSLQTGSQEFTHFSVTLTGQLEDLESPLAWKLAPLLHLPSIQLCAEVPGEPTWCYPWRLTLLPQRARP